MSAQYVLGIDLGTTNSVLAYASLEPSSPRCICWACRSWWTPGRWSGVGAALVHLLGRRA